MDLSAFQAIAAGGDLATMAILFFLVKHHVRLSVLEAALISKG